jgi:hypothetical protein
VKRQEDRCASHFSLEPIEMSLLIGYWLQIRVKSLISLRNRSLLPVVTSADTRYALSSEVEGPTRRCARTRATTRVSHATGPLVVSFDVCDVVRRRAEGRSRAARRHPRAGRSNRRMGLLCPDFSLFRARSRRVSAHPDTTGSAVSRRGRDGRTPTWPTRLALLAPPPSAELGKAPRGSALTCKRVLPKFPERS